jgi:hypothetical protein
MPSKYVSVIEAPQAVETISGADFPAVKFFVMRNIKNIALCKSNPALIPHHFLHGLYYFCLKVIRCPVMPRRYCSIGR